MTTTQLQLPRPIDAQKGDHVRIVLDCVAGDESLVVEEMHVRNALADTTTNTDKSAAAATYVRKWGGALAPLTDKEVDDLLYDAIMEKHSQHLK